MQEGLTGPACARCGEQNPAGARFCHRCGLNLAAPPASPSSEAAPAPSPPAGKKVCAACRTINEPASAYCYQCGVKLPEQVLTTAEAIGNPAGFWVRLLAFVIDNLLGDGVTLLIFVFLTGGRGITDALSGENWGYTFLNWGLSTAYYTYATGRWGKTLGKHILGLKVIRAGGAPVSYWRSFGRYWAYLLSFIPLGLGFIWIALTSHKRGWHDHLCDTRVIKTRG